MSEAVVRITAARGRLHITGIDIPYYGISMITGLVDNQPHLGRT